MLTIAAIVLLPSVSSLGDSGLFLRFPPMLAPAMQADLADGRDTSVTWTLEEIVGIGLWTFLILEDESAALIGCGRFKGDKYVSGRKPRCPECGSKFEEWRSG